MMKRELAEEIEQQYFDSVDITTPEENEGTKDMAPLLPFIISGGTNTEYYYFKHISKTTKYKFQIIPEYFGNESNHTNFFPYKIRNVLDNNVGAKVFCVFDLDTICGNASRIKKHQDFEKQFETEITSGCVVLCPSMPCIEYWFLLHFENDTTLYKTYSKVSNKLPQEFKSYFPNPEIRLKKLLKHARYLEDSIWVENLCSNGKLELAIERAKNNIETALKNNNLEGQSYSFVYKLFRQ